jgi:hypothetical protein
LVRPALNIKEQWYMACGLRSDQIRPDHWFFFVTEIFVWHLNFYYLNKFLSFMWIVIIIIFSFLNKFYAKWIRYSLRTLINLWLVCKFEVNRRSILKIEARNTQWKWLLLLNHQYNRRYAMRFETLLSKIVRK